MLIRITRDDKVSANQTIAFSLVIYVGLPASISALWFIFETKLLEIFGCTEEVYQWTKDYSTIYIAGDFSTALFYLSYFLKLIGRLKTLTFFI